MWTKIYAYTAKGASVFDPVLEQFAHRPTIHTIGADTWFVGVPVFATTRAAMNALDGVTVLPAHVSPAKLTAGQIALLAKHGVDSTDSIWSAIGKVVAKLGLPDHFDPNV